MNGQMKLDFHLEMVVWEDIGERVRLTKKQIEDLMAKATDDQKRRAYQRALVRQPLLLPEERHDLNPDRS